MIVARRWGNGCHAAARADNEAATSRTPIVAHREAFQKMEQYWSALRQVGGDKVARPHIGVYNELLEACTMAVAEEREEHDWRTRLESSSSVSSSSATPYAPKTFEPYPGYHGWVNPLDGPAARAEEIYEELRDLLRARSVVELKIEEGLRHGYDSEMSERSDRFTGRTFRQAFELELGHAVTLVQRRTLSALIECMDMATANIQTTPSTEAIARVQASDPLRTHATSRSERLRNMPWLVSNAISNMKSGRSVGNHKKKRGEEMRASQGCSIANMSNTPQPSQPRSCPHSSQVLCARRG